MIGHWIKRYNGEASEGGTICIYECSVCHRQAPATQFPLYFEDKDGKWNDPNYCPWCGSDNRERESNDWKMAEVIICNMEKLIKNYEEYKDEEDSYWWFDEYGADLTDDIDCHPVFVNSNPCLNEVRGYRGNCSECKAKWLMGVYE